MTATPSEGIKISELTAGTPAGTEQIPANFSGQTKRGAGYVDRAGNVAFTADQSMGGNKLTNLATPTAGTDATNKTYVDSSSTPSPHDFAGSGTITDGDGYTHIINSATGTITLPTLADNYNREITIIRDVAGSSTPLIIDGEGSETINGKTTLNLYGFGAGYKIFASQDAGEWVVTATIDSQLETWSPTFTPLGSMTYTSVTVAFATWHQSGNRINFSIRTSGTTGGTASNRIDYSLPTPINTSYTAYAVMTNLVDVGAGQVSGQGQPNSGDVINNFRYDFANFQLGSNFQIRGSGYYLI